jgi:hypothetical protein
VIRIAIRSLTAVIRRLTARKRWSGMTAITVWHGTTMEGMTLSEVSTHNCQCEMDPESGIQSSTCPMHDAMVRDQRFLDGLVFARRIARQLLEEEFG